MFIKLIQTHIRYPQHYLTFLLPWSFDLAASESRGVGCRGSTSAQYWSEVEKRTIHAAAQAASKSSKGSDLIGSGRGIFQCPFYWDFSGSSCSLGELVRAPFGELGGDGQMITKLASPIQLHGG